MFINEMSDLCSITNNPICYLYPPLLTKDIISDTSNHINTLLPKTLIERILYSQKRKLNLIEKEKQVLTDFLLNSNLIKRLHEDKINNPKNDIDFQTTCKACIDTIQLKKIEKGDYIFHINDPGEARYFLLYGHLASLKPKKIPNCTMTIDTYLIYLINLKNANEIHLLTLVLQQNYDILPIASEHGLQLYINHYIKSRIDKDIKQTAINVPTLKKFLNKYQKTINDFNFTEEQMKAKFKECRDTNNWYHRWLEFIYKSFRPNTEEVIFMDNNPQLDTINLVKIHNISCIQYETDTQYNNGDFFGHYSIDNNEKRSVSVRAEQDSFIVSLTYDQYLKLVSPKIQLFKIKAFSFLYEKFFFKVISQITFEKHYLNLFTFHEKIPNTILFHGGSPIDEVIFIMKGEVRISITCSITDMHNILKFSLDTIEELDPNGISKNTIIEMRNKSLDDPNLIKLQSTIGSMGRFSEEMNFKKTFKLSSLGDNDILGIEEAFLRTNHFTTCEVGKDPIQYYSISIKSLKKIFASNYECVEPYTYLAIKKITNFLSRINQLKQNSVAISLSKIRIDNQKIILKQSTILKSLNHSNSTPIIHLDYNKKGQSKRLIHTFISNRMSKENHFFPNIQSLKNCSTNNDIIEKTIEHPENKNSSIHSRSFSNTSNAKLQKKHLPVKHHLNIISRTKKASLIPSLEVGTNKLTIEAIKKQTIQLKSTDVYQNFSIRDELLDQAKVSILNFQSLESNITIPCISPSIKGNYLNSHITERLKAFKIKQNKQLLRTQEERLDNIERTMAENLLNDGTNIIAEKVKHFYFIKKLKGYSIIGKGKNSLQKNHIMKKITTQK